MTVGEVVLISEVVSHFNLMHLTSSGELHPIKVEKKSKVDFACHSKNLNDKLKLF